MLKFIERLNIPELRKLLQCSSKIAQCSKSLLILKLQQMIKINIMLIIIMVEML